MTHRSQEGALIGGLILIALGFLFLLGNWLPDWSLGEIISRYWPVILILIGVQSLYRYFTYTPPPPPPPAAPPSSDRPSSGWTGPQPPTNI